MNEKVFISSTYKDLKDHRAAVIERLRQDGFHPIDMGGARDDEALLACLWEISEADFFVGIYAWRYGFVPKGSEISITEWEYKDARLLGLPCFCYMAAGEPQSWPGEYREEGRGAQQLDRFKAELEVNHVPEKFTSPESLAAAVAAALVHKREQRRNVAQPPTPERCQDLNNLLERVEKQWIKGVLEKEVTSGRFMKIDHEERADKVGRPVESGRAEKFPGFPDPLYILFHQRERSLLILGVPGAGRIALLQLARDLIARAKRNPTAPVPTIVHLGSWKQGKPWIEWLAHEMLVCYRIGKEKTEEWTGAGRLLLLLDGLDETHPDDLTACIEVLKALPNYGVEECAVCCNTEVYPERPLLSLRSAVLLRPLDARRIDEYLEDEGPSRAGLRQFLKESLAKDVDLQELASSPPMLSLMASAYCDADAETIARSLEEPGESRRKLIFERYVKLMLEPERYYIDLPGREPGASLPYSSEVTLGSLAWLARKMRKHSPVLFHLERLQPSWLSTGELRVYAVASRGLAGLLAAFPLALLYGPIPLLAGPLAGAAIGALESLRLRRAETGNEQRRGPAFLRAQAWWLLLAVAAFLSFNLAGLIWGGVTRDFDLRRDLDQGLVFGSLFGALFAVLLGVRGDRRDATSDIRIVEELEWRRWSWKGAGAGALTGPLLGLACGGISFLKARFLDPGWLQPGIGIWLVFSAFLGLLGSLSGGLLGGLGGKAIGETSPNQGVRVMLRNAGIVLARATPIVLSLALLLSILLPLRLGLGPSALRSLLEWFSWSLGLYVWIGLWSSGLDFLQHFTLRSLLRLRGAVPPDLVRFLEHAYGRGLLQRVGGGYKFRYSPRLRDDYFALLSAEDIRAQLRAAPAAGGAAAGG